MRQTEWVCVSVREREREREIDITVSTITQNFFTITFENVYKGFFQRQIFNLEFLSCWGREDDSEVFTRPK